MTTSIDHLLETNLDGSAEPVSFLPEPEKREAIYTVISVDDHIVEPPWTFEGRFPERLQKMAPRIVELPNGREAWIFNDDLHPNVGFNAVAGRPASEYRKNPTRFNEMRRGAWDIGERILDMDINGVYASLKFPSSLPGSVGSGSAR